MIIEKGMAGRRLVLAVATLLLAINPLLAGPDSYRIDLPTQTFFPKDDNAAWFDNRPDEGYGSTILLQFEEHPDTPAKQTLARKGVVLQMYIGSGTWVTWVEKGVTSEALASTSPRWAGPLASQDRLSEAIRSDQMPQWAEGGNGSRLYAVRLVSTVYGADGEALLSPLVDEIGDYVEIFNTWYIRGSVDTPLRLAQMPEVLYVDYIAPPLTENNASVRATMFVDPVQVAPYNLDGSGVTACVYDGGLVDISHLDFGGRATQGEGGGISDHPTHVAGTLGGNGDPTVRGMAPNVSIISYAYEACDPFCLYNSPQDIWDNYTEAVLLGGARLVTNSIGANVVSNGYSCSWLGDYELTSALVDSAVRGGLGEEVVVLFSAGNERISGSPCGTGFGTVSIPASAKNIITVGAFSDNGSIASFSSFGPTDDGRIKPEIAGNGVNVYSTVPGGGYDTMSGTSMSCPATAGVVALLMQAWDRHPDLPRPTPAQVKALLVTGADDAGVSGPDYQYGFGRVDANDTVDIVGKYGFASGEVEDEGQWTMTFEVAPGVTDLKVSLAWSDPPAAQLAPVTLVNDLDLTLTSPISSTFYPFVLDGDNPGNPATNGRNSIDVVEQIFVSDPAAGTWTIVVDGYDIPFGPQEFSLAATVPLHENVVFVHGTVSDSETASVIAGASVRLNGVEDGVVSDANGWYSFYHKLDGDAELVCSMPGYTTQRGYVLANSEGPEVERNFALNTGGVESIQGVVLDADGGEAISAEVVDLENPSTLVTTDAEGLFTLSLTIGELHRLRATLGEQSGSRDLYLTPETVPPLLVIEMALDSVHTSGPDADGYLAIQNGDAHALAPEYAWVEIDPDEGGAGIRLPMSEEDTPYEVELPFTFVYYGVSYDTVTVNENGMFFFGAQGTLDDETAGDFSNTGIPGLDGPPAMVAPFWEDFRAEATNFSTWYDETNGLFYLEWFNSRQYPTDATFETFQTVLYDPEVHTTQTGDGLILFQYQDVNDLLNATVGIEAPDEEDGLGLLYYDADGNGSTIGSVGTITDGTAILFVRESASLSGTVTLVPENGDVTITISGDGFEALCDEAGGFAMTNLLPQITELTISAPGYEMLRVGVDLSIPNPDPVEVELYALLAPTGLTGEDVEGNFQLSWQAPDLPTTSFEDLYRVYRDGQQVVEVAETEWLDEGPFTMESVYWVTAVYSGGESDTTGHVSPGGTSAVGENALPQSFEVSAAWPNPFNPSTSIRVALPNVTPLRVEVVDLLGRQVAVLVDSRHATPGTHRLTWDGSGHASGLYFVRVQAGRHNAVRKVMLLK
ncbi:S8 family serine peptidase [bacterium]|nr:S8 family serine peptidase [bacterium]